ncbi:MAG TPA: hypothetical protein PKY59_06120 [Pyrinomonadaceae bacterium]|nr:hypothetical protein [Pyrinomonadaceae bacterium]
MKFITFLLIFLFTISNFGCKSLTKLFSNYGTLLIIKVEEVEANQDETTNQAVNVLKTRLNAFGANADVEKTSANRIEVKIYGDADIPRIKNLLISQSRLEFCKVVTPSSPAPLQTYPTEEAARQSLGGKVPINRKILPYTERDNARNSSPDTQKSFVVIENPSVVDGRELRDATVIESANDKTNFEIAFRLTSKGGQTFGDWTAKNINNYLAVVLNDEVKSAPFIKSQIIDSGVISGRFTKEQAQDLVLILKSGYFPTKLTLIEETAFDQ